MVTMLFDIKHMGIMKLYVFYSPETILASSVWLTLLMLELEDF